MWIIVEGLDGSGKSTAIEILKNELESQGKKVIVTQGIGTGDIGSYLREEIVKKENLTPAMEAIAFPLAILDCLRKVKEYLDLDYVIITDRFIGSYWAYAKSCHLTDQMYGHLLKQVYSTIPDLYIAFRYIYYINSPIEACLNRISKRGNAKYFDKAPIEEFERVNKRYKEWLEVTPNIITIPNDSTLEEFKSRIIKNVRNFYI